MRTVGEIATPFDIEDPAYIDLYLGSTFGLDASVGYKMGLLPIMHPQDGLM